MSMRIIDNLLSLPIVQALAEVPQAKKHHPEGDVLKHTKQVSYLCHYLGQSLPAESYRTLIRTAVFHDIGKAVTTRQHEDGRITAYGHESRFDHVIPLWRELGWEEEEINRVSSLIRVHMQRVVGKKTCRKLFARGINTFNMAAILWRLQTADHFGRSAEAVGREKQTAFELYVSNDLSFGAPSATLIYAAMQKHLSASVA